MLLTDGELIQKIRSGESEAFKIIFSRYKTNVFNYAIYLTRVDFDAEDLFQETWVRAVNKIHGNIEIINFKAWILTIMINIHRDELRKKKIRRVFFPFQSSSFEKITENLTQRGNTNTENKYPDFDLKASFKTALFNLPLKQRRVFVLKAIEGFKHREISEMLKTPIGTVKSLLHQAVKSLQKELADFNF